jgi:hypothetical protein
MGNPEKCSNTSKLDRKGREVYVPKVTVIVPVYNGGPFIEQALESVFEQTFRDFEILVINDGSTDETEARLTKYSDRIKYLKQENMGLAATRGRGVEMSRGPLVAFLDADDVWLPHKLERQVEAARQHPECGIITTDALSFLGDRVLVTSLKEWYRPASGGVLENLLFGNWIPPSAAMVRRECFDLVKTFRVPPPAYGEDWLMWMQIAAHYPVHFVDQVLVRRRRHPGGMSSQGEDIQFNCLLRNFEIIRQRVPRLNGKPNLIDLAVFRVCLRRGILDLRAVRVREARMKIKLAVRYKPLSIRAWGALAAAHLPPWVLGTAKHVTGSMRRLVARPAGSS